MKNFYPIPSIFHSIVIFASLIFLSACTTGKKSTMQKERLGAVELVFKPMVGNNPLYLDSIYHSPAKEEYFLKSLKFFISNIAFSQGTQEENKAVLEGNSHGVSLLLLDENNKEMVLKLKARQGDFSGLHFDIGVPRFLNHADPSLAKPPLDLNDKGMFWDWNSGYIFLLATGGGPDVRKNSFHLAIGADTRTMPFSFGNLFNLEPLVKIKEKGGTRITLKIDFNKLFTNPDNTLYSLKNAESAVVHGGFNADLLRLNLLQAIEVVSVEVLEDK